MKWLVPALSALLFCLADCATGGSETGTGASPQAAAVLVDPPARTGARLSSSPCPSRPASSRSARVWSLRCRKTQHPHLCRRAGNHGRRACRRHASHQPGLRGLDEQRHHQPLLPGPDVQSDRQTPPAVLLMASFVEQAQARLRRATGIAYEVPGVTAFVHLRSVIATPVNRVGVIYRPPFRAFIQRQTSLAPRNMSSSSPSPCQRRHSGWAARSPSQPRRKSKVDAVWMLNDNGLVRDAEFVDDTWRTELSDAKMPLIVGVPNLVAPGSSLGTLAVVPDHEALGLQLRILCSTCRTMTGG